MHHARTLLASTELTVSSLLLTASLLVTTGLVLHEADDAAMAAAGVLWPTVVFAGLHATTRAVSQDAHGGGLTGALLLPVPRSTVLLSRAFVAGGANLVLALVAVGVTAAVMPGDVQLLSAGLAAVLAPAAIGLALVATAAAFAGGATTARDLVAPALALPLMMPVLVAGVHGSMAAMDGAAWAELAPHVTFLTGYVVLLAGLTMLVADAVVDA